MAGGEAAFFTGFWRRHVISFLVLVQRTGLTAQQISFVTFSIILYGPLYAKSNTLSVDLCSDSTAFRFRYLLITTAHRLAPQLKQARFETGPNDAIDRSDWIEWRFDDLKAAKKEPLGGMTHWPSLRLDHRPLPGGVYALSLQLLKEVVGFWQLEVRTR
jgi:hypothetical protein